MYYYAGQVMPGSDVTETDTQHVFTALSGWNVMTYLGPDGTLYIDTERTEFPLDASGQLGPQRYRYF